MTISDKPKFEGFYFLLAANTLMPLNGILTAVNRHKNCLNTVIDTQATCQIQPSVVKPDHFRLAVLEQLKIGEVSSNKANRSFLFDLTIRQ